MNQGQRRHGRPVVRRDAEGNERTAPSWEALPERLIREAQQDGAFEGLPDHGRPLRLDDDTYAGDMAAANRVLRNAGAAPPWIETDKEVRRRLEAIEVLLVQASRSPGGARERLESELGELADAHDEAVARLDVQAPTPRQQRTRLDRKLVHQRLLEALSGERSTS